MDCTAAYKFCMEEIEQPYFNQGFNPFDMRLKCETDSPLCYAEMDALEDYLNQDWIREALGIDPTFGNYSSIGFRVNYDFWLAGDELSLTDLYVVELLERGIKFLVYAGTYDFVCNWIGNEKWTLDMEWTGAQDFREQPLAEWTSGGNPAGKFRSHQSLTFATVYGAGHMVPYDKPAVALEMLTRWLKDEPL